MIAARISALSFATLLVLISLVDADVYMHSPRGSNDRNWCMQPRKHSFYFRLFDAVKQTSIGTMGTVSSTPRTTVSLHSHCISRP